MAPRTNHSLWKLFRYAALTLLVTSLAAAVRAGEPDAPPARTALINAALGRPISCEFQNTPLADVVTFLGEKLDVTLALDNKALDEVGVGSDTPITIQLTGISAASTLRLMLRQIDPALTFFITDGALMITTRKRAEENLETRFYDIADLAADVDVKYLLRVSERSNPFHADFDSIAEIIVSTIEVISWEDVGGPGSIDIRDGIMIVSQTREVHDDIQLALTAFRKAAAAHKASSTDLSPIALSPAMHIEVEKAFAKMLDGKGLNLTFQETPLGDVVQALSEVTKKTVLLDHNALHEVGIGADTPVTFQLKGLTLRDEIRWILRQLDLTYRIGDEALIITTPEAAEENLPTLLYPVWDLVGDDRSRDYDSLIELMTSTVEPDSWVEVGGPGSIAAYPHIGCLVVSQNRDVHEKIQDMLARLREVKNNRKVTTESGADDDPYVVALYHLRPSWNDPVVPSGIGGYFSAPQEQAREAVAVQSNEKAEKSKVVEQVVPLVEQLIEPTSWKSDDAAIRPLGKNLVVRQRVSVQRRIDELLRSLELLEWPGAKY